MSLAETIADPDRKQALITAAMTEVEDEVSGLGGLKGKAIGVGYNTVKKLRPGFFESNIERMLPMFVPVLDSRLTEARSSDAGVESYFAANADAVAEDLLAVTDKRAGEANNKAAVKVYEKLRGGAKDQVVAAMPRVARLADVHG